MVALAFLIKEAGEKGGSSRKPKEGREPESTDSPNSPVEPERAQDGGRGRQTREVVVLGEAFRLI